MKTKTLILPLLALLALAAVPVSAATYDIDLSHSSVNFQIKHLAISKVNGSFNAFGGTFTYVDGKPGEWSVNATIDATSIDTGNEDRDKHLSSPDFFDVAQFPELTFASTGAKDGKLMGDLTMHGVTKAVELDLEFLGAATDPWGNEKVAFTATGKVNRKDWGLTWNKALETGGVVVGEDVKITLEIQGVKQK